MDALEGQSSGKVDRGKARSLSQISEIMTAILNADIIPAS